MSRPARYTSLNNNPDGQNRAGPVDRSCTRSASQWRDAADRYGGQHALRSTMKNHRLNHREINLTSGGIQYILCQ